MPKRWTRRYTLCLGFSFKTLSNGYRCRQKLKRTSRQDSFNGLHQSMSSLESVQACIEYWKHICDYLVDPDDLVAGAAFGAILSLIEKHNAMKAASIASPWSVLFERWHDLCFTSLTTHLTAVLHRSSQLDAAGLVFKFHFAKKLNTILGNGHQSCFCSFSKAFGTEPFQIAADTFALDYPFRWDILRRMPVFH